ncbi:MAG: lipoyl synthase, partial [Anaerolineae bacterium]
MTIIPLDEVEITEPQRAREVEAQSPTHPQRRPEWLKVRAPSGETYENLKRLMRVKTLHTVCEEALCPNIGECWGRGTATFLMMGDVCTRSCGFCDIKTGRPKPLDWDEPRRVAEAIHAMNLNHAVITSVNRDERKDGGAPIFAMVIREVRTLQPGCTVEVLIPDFKGSLDALKIVVDAQPDILNHNVETVPRLFRKVQPQDRYEWAMATLGNAKKLNPNQITK